MSYPAIRLAAPSSTVPPKNPMTSQRVSPRPSSCSRIAKLALGILALSSLFTQTAYGAPSCPVFEPVALMPKSYTDSQCPSITSIPNASLVEEMKTIYTSSLKNFFTYPEATYSKQIEEPARLTLSLQKPAQALLERLKYLLEYPDKLEGELSTLRESLRTDLQSAFPILREEVSSKVKIDYLLDHFLHVVYQKLAAHTVRSKPFYRHYSALSSSSLFRAKNQLRAHLIFHKTLMHSSVNCERAVFGEDRFSLPRAVPQELEHLPYRVKQLVSTHFPYSICGETTGPTLLWLSEYWKAKQNPIPPASSFPWIAQYLIGSPSSKRAVEKASSFFQETLPREAQIAQLAQNGIAHNLEVEDQPLVFPHHFAHTRLGMVIDSTFSFSSFSFSLEAPISWPDGSYFLSLQPQGARSIPGLSSDLLSAVGIVVDKQDCFFFIPNFGTIHSPLSESHTVFHQIVNQFYFQRALPKTVQLSISVISLKPLELAKTDGRFEKLYFSPLSKLEQPDSSLQSANLKEIEGRFELFVRSVLFLSPPIEQSRLELPPEIFLDAQKATHQLLQADPELRKAMLLPSLTSYHALVERRKKMVRQLLRNIDRQTSNTTLIYIEGFGKNQTKATGHLSKIEIIEKIILEEFSTALSVTWHALLESLVKKKEAKMAQVTFDKMRLAGVLPDAVGYALLIDAYGEAKEIENAQAIFNQIAKTGVKLTIQPINSLIRAYAYLEDPKGAKRVYDSIQEILTPTTPATAQAVLHAYARAGDAIGARSFFNQLKNRDPVCWCLLLQAYATASDIEGTLDAFNQMKLAKIPQDLRAWIFVLNVYERTRNAQKAQETFDAMQAAKIQPNRDAWISLLNAYVRAEDAKGAQAAFDKMEKSPLKPDELIFDHLIGAYKAAKDEEGFKIASAKKERRFGIPTPQVNQTAITS